MKNQIQLITYVDRIACKNIIELDQLLTNELDGLFGGVHILPFFYPIDGEDAGFDPINHKKVDPRLGDWSNIKKLSNSTEIMADLIVNHMSADSVEFKDFVEKGENSPYASLFLTYDKVFPKGATEKNLLQIYRPRPGFPFTKFKLADGSQKLVWTTFTQKQIDIDVFSEGGNAYLEEILAIYQQAGIKMIRLDAAGYAIKKAGTSCFMIPETFDFIDELTKKARAKGIAVLVEIHSFYKTQIEIAKKVDFVYDFALPVLVLDTLFNADATNLKKWLQIAPRNVVTVLDTHDGIGIVDVASEGDEDGLIPDNVLDNIVNKMHANSEGRSLKATGAAASNLDLYQVNCTYFEALGSNEVSYLMARAIQFFVPGIPQVYYVGLFGDENDMELLAKTNVGRDINRHYYTKEEIQKKTASSLFEKLSQLMKLRNTHPAFNGEFNLEESSAKYLEIKWVLNTESIQLKMDLENKSFEIKGAANEVESLLMKV
ncbi:sucrose phosphorylase [Croceivirga lutea]|uniref:sucrose phosphorylase n=1 Tax=Croceivirga lutea TaxID=1775167 RepID=UPI001639CE6F|nr:sucrose phosphorylase [Croceivirga lutea]GGG54419.1 sucrose phosphorylase [Croceivirga lutea]